MNKNKILKRPIKYCLIIIITIILVAHFVHVKDLKSTQNTINSSNESKINISSVETYTIPWLKNSNFSSDESWLVIKEGEITDVSAYINNSQANYVVIGEEGTFSNVSGVPLDWDNVTNPQIPTLPDVYEIDEYGFHVSHLWVGPDDPAQYSSIHWERIITMPINMSDYIINSASVSAVFNASVTTQPGGADYPSDYCGIDSGDFIRFYVLISDIENNWIYEIASYQTVDLGQDDPEIANITDSFMNNIEEEILIFFLNSLFEHDNFQFKITIGMRIYCADNYLYDRDSWDSLRIKSCNFNFTYQKKIDQFTSISYYQQGNSITGSNTQITNATLNFKYKIDQAWPTLLSPNSEIRVLINDNTLTEGIKLSSATTLFQEAKLGGFNVTDLIQKDVNISVSIQIYIADTFLLDRNITISIDDVYLIISYIVTSFTPPTIFFEPSEFFLNPLTPEYFHDTMEIKCTIEDDSPIIWAYCCENSSGSFVNQTMTPLGDGNWSVNINIETLNWNDVVSFSFYACDSLGNIGKQDNLSVLYNIKIEDFQPPETQIQYSPYFELTIVSNLTIFSFEVTDMGGSGISHVLYRINNSAWMDYDSPFNLSEYSFGYWVISYYSIDNVGNIEEVRTLNVKLVESFTAKKENIPGYNCFIILGIIGVFATIIVRKRLN